MRFAGPLIACCAAASAQAEPFVPTQGQCKPLLTAFTSDCTVTNFQRCDGNRTYISQYDIDDWPIAALTNADFALGHTWEIGTDKFIVEHVSTIMPFSITTLMRDGSIQSENIVKLHIALGTPQAHPMHGTFRITGESVQVGSRTLDVVAFTHSTIMGFAGNLMYINGRYLLDRQSQVMIEENATTEFFGTSMDVGADVVHVAGPGEPGFMSTDPEDFCRPQLSALTPQYSGRAASAPLFEGDHHDNI